MKIFSRILALFLIVPILELALLVQVDELIGFWPTIGLIVLTAVLGSMLARREGLSVWRRFNRSLAEGGLPGKELLDGVIILVAGALLITPGVLTDFVGFIGLLPPTRAVIRKYAMKRIERAVQRGTVAFAGFDGWTTDSEEEARWRGTAADVPRHAGTPARTDLEGDEPDTL